MDKNFPTPAETMRAIMENGKRVAFAYRFIHLRGEKAGK